MLEVIFVTVGTVLSITMFLFAEREFICPGTGKVKTTSFELASLIVPPPVLIIFKPPLESPT